MKLYKWDEKTQGRNYEISDLPTELRDMMLSNRNSLIDDISTFDDGLANFIIQSDSMDNISPNILMKGIRNACLSCNVVPVLLGSAYKNVGIQSLMNGILNYLPNAKERNTIYNCFGDNFVGKVFKVIHDQRRGPLSLVRVYRGKLKKGTKIVSARGISEVVMGLFEPLADEYHEISEVSAGNVAIISGLKVIKPNIFHSDRHLILIYTLYSCILIVYNYKRLVSSKFQYFTFSTKHIGKKIKVNRH